MTDLPGVSPSPQISTSISSSTFTGDINKKKNTQKLTKKSVLNEQNCVTIHKCSSYENEKSTKNMKQKLTIREGVQNCANVRSKCKTINKNTKNSDSKTSLKKSSNTNICINTIQDEVVSLPEPSSSLLSSKAALEDKIDAVTTSQEKLRKELLQYMENMKSSGVVKLPGDFDEIVNENC